MATRGAKPKAAILRIVDGTHRPDRHGPADKAREAAETAAKFGPLVRPKHLKGHAAAAWNRYIAPAAWLDVSREPLAVAFCELWQEFREAPARFAATKHGQLRHYMAELGLSDERNRKAPDGDAKRDEFFND